MKKVNIKFVTVTAVMGALSFVLMLLEFPIPAIMPFFIKFDFSDLPALITSFAYGPIYGVLVCLLKNILHMTITRTAVVGELANFLLGAVFVFVAGLVYKYNKTRKGAILASLTGAIAMGLISIPVNYFITYPFFTSMGGYEESDIINIYKAIYPKVKSLIQALVIFNAPFTLVKGVIDSVICFVVYKKLSPILKARSKDTD